MIIISHRGNLNGSNPLEENCPDYILKARQLGYDVEIDVWHIDGHYWLGHDMPQYGPINYDFLLKSNLWIHAKNANAYYNLLQNTNINVFWHTTEDFVLTSFGDLWTYPGKPLFPGSICVLPELGYDGNLSDCKGICTDYTNKNCDKFIK